MENTTIATEARMAGILAKIAATDVRIGTTLRNRVGSIETRLAKKYVLRVTAAGCVSLLVLEEEGRCFVEARDLNGETDVEAARAILETIS